MFRLSICLCVFLSVFKAYAYQQESLQEPRLFQLKSDQWTEVKTPHSGSIGDAFLRNLSVADMAIIGELVWEIVEEGEPVLEFESERLGVLPQGIKSAFELDHWKAPVTSTYKVVYENFLGIEMVSFSYRLVFTPGGVYQGKGLYLTNIAIEPVSVDVGWGYELNAKFEAMDILNLGTKENPHAGLELKLQWSVDTLVQKTLHQSNFFIRGDGHWELL